MQWTRLIQNKRRTSNKLTVELTPKTVRSKSLFHYYMKNKKLNEWSEIKQELLEREGSKCWICGTTSNHLHIFEFWNYDEKERSAQLTEIHHLCDLCYKIKRTDLWFFTDYGKEQLKHLGICREDLIKHFCKVNQCSLKDFALNWKVAITNWHKRNDIDWKQNFGDYIFSPRE